MGCTRHGLNREPPPPPPLPPPDPSILYRRSSTKLAPRYRATISPSGRRFQKRKLDCFRGWKEKERKKERKGTVPPMKKKRNRRGSAPSSCAPASCPTSSSSRVPRSHRAFPSLPVALRLRLLRRTMSHCPPPCTFVARSREPPRLDRTRSFHHTPLPPLRDNRREE